MTNLASSPPALPRSENASPTLEAQLRVSGYDRAASTMISLLILLGALVLVLISLAVTQRLATVEATVPVEYVEDARGREDHAIGLQRDLEPPGAEESMTLAEPQFEPTLQAVTDAVSSLAASLASVEGDVVTTRGRSGMGDDRLSGPMELDHDTIPRSERWQIQYPSGNLRQYARILDFFKIELGVVGGGRKEVEYAVNLSSRPAKRSGAPDKEDRLYMTWRGGEMKQADAELMGQAGINVSNSVQMQFLPADTENLLAAVERTAMGQRTLKGVQKTVFGVRPQGAGYEFFVVDQRYRTVR
jgi:hypothetical protein